MRAFREQDFDQMAERVVDRFMNGAKLADAATAEAAGGALNPDQIARMVQAANTQAFLRLMDQQKAQGVPDMTNEFDPIDARQIVQQLINQVHVPHMDGPGGEMPSMPGAGGMPPHGPEDDAMLPPHAEPDGDEGGMPPMPPGGDDGPLPNEMGLHDLSGDEPDEPAHGAGDDDDGPFPKGKKQKAKDDGDKKDKKKSPFPPKKDEAKEAAFRGRRIDKLASVLEDQYKQAEWAFEDVFANLGQQLRRAHGAPSAAAFEKDALALHNHEIGLVVLNMVKESQGLPPISADDAATKTAALADRHLVDDTETNRTFATLVKIAVDANRLCLGAAHARSQCS